jgi:hypothetical protein
VFVIPYLLKVSEGAEFRSICILPDTPLQAPKINIPLLSQAAYSAKKYRSKGSQYHEGVMQCHELFALRSFSPRLRHSA